MQTMAESSKKIVFIVGLSRVGSTMLDLVLGCNPKFIGLGEIFQVLRPDMNRFELIERCSCGKFTPECPFWGVATKGLKEIKSAGIEARYRHVLNVFENVFGSDHIPIDSSKLLSVLKTIVGFSDVEVKVIYLIRDVRAWTISRLNHRKLKPDHYKKDGHYKEMLSYQFGWKMNIFKWVIPLITKLPLYYFLLWYFQNRQIKKFLKNNHIDYFCLGYDELGMNPDLMMKKIFEFLGEKIQDPDFNTVNTQSHIWVGNVKKKVAKRRQGIFYDNRWMYRNDWLLPAALLPKIMRYNAEEVYKNIKNHSIWDK